MSLGVRASTDNQWDSQSLFKKSAKCEKPTKPGDARLNRVADGAHDLYKAGRFGAGSPDSAGASRSRKSNSANHYGSDSASESLDDVGHNEQRPKVKNSVQSAVVPKVRGEDPVPPLYTPGNSSADLVAEDVLNICVDMDERLHFEPAQAWEYRMYSEKRTPKALSKRTRGTSRPSIPWTNEVNDA